jgi:hypothetical protein
MNAKGDQQPEPGVPPGPWGAFSPALDDPHVAEALEQYLAALQAGQKPNRQAFLARHAEIAEALAECLDGMEVLHVAGSSSHQPAEEVGTASTFVEWQPGTLLVLLRYVSLASSWRNHKLSGLWMPNS